MSQMSASAVPAGARSAESHRAVAMIVYVLYFAALVCGITMLIGVIMAYARRGDARGTVWESHFANQISVFWTTIIVGLIGAVTAFIGIGFLILFGLFVWYLYRTIRGTLRAADGLPYV